MCISTGSKCFHVVSFAYTWVTSALFNIFILTFDISSYFHEFPILHLLLFLFENCSIYSNVFQPFDIYLPFFFFSFIQHCFINLFSIQLPGSSIHTYFLQEMHSLVDICHTLMWLCWCAKENILPPWQKKSVEWAVLQCSAGWIAASTAKRMCPIPPPNVVWVIGSQCVLNAAWVCSHLYLIWEEIDDMEVIIMEIMKYNWIRG